MTEYELRVVETGEVVADGRLLELVEWAMRTQATGGMPNVNAAAGYKPPQRGSTGAEARPIPEELINSLVPVLRQFTEAAIELHVTDLLVPLIEAEEAVARFVMEREAAAVEAFQVEQRRQWDLDRLEYNRTGVYSEAAKARNKREATQ